MTAEEAEDLLQASDVLSVAPSMPLKLIDPVSDNNQEVLEPFVSSVTWGIKAIGADISPFTGKDIVPAVLDTGINPNHVAFAGIDLVKKNYTTEVDDDINGHGTHCAGTIFGREVNGKRIGVAQGVNKAIIAKVLGAGGGVVANS